MDTAGRQRSGQVKSSARPDEFEPQIPVRCVPQRLVHPSETERHIAAEEVARHRDEVLNKEALKHPVRTRQRILRQPDSERAPQLPDTIPVAIDVPRWIQDQRSVRKLTDQG